MTILIQSCLHMVKADLKTDVNKETESLSLSGVEIRFVSLSPKERGFYLGVEGSKIGRTAMLELYRHLNAKDERATDEWLDKYYDFSSAQRKNRNHLVQTLLTHVIDGRMEYFQDDQYDYFEELKRQYKFYLNEQTVSGIQLFHSTEEIVAVSIVKKVEAPLAFIIEGIHSLGLGNKESTDEKENTCREISTGRIKSRIRQIKGEENLEDDELKSWEFPPVMMRLANNFGNGIFGHAKSFFTPTQGVLDQREFLDKGVIKASGYEIVRELLGLDEHLQPTGSRRILIDMHHLSASCRDDLYQSIFRKFNRNISPEHPIPVVFTEAAYSGIDYLAEMIRNTRNGTESDNFRVNGYNASSINLSDEDILEVFRSHGLISFTLEEARMGIDQGGLEKLFLNTARAKAVRILSRQLAGIISVPFAYHLNNPLLVWNYLNIGSTLSGKGKRLERYRCNGYEATLEQDLEEALTKLKKEEPMWFGSYKPDHLVRKICHDNISAFVFRNY